MSTHHIATPQVKYTYGCIMLYVKYYNLQFTHTWIPEKHIFNDTSNMYGLESYPHITLLSNVLAGVSRSTVENVLNKINLPPNLKLETKLSRFDANSKGAVPLKFDVIESDTTNQLNDIHKLLKEEIPNECEYDEYHPHMTIGYVKDRHSNHYGNNSDGKNIISHTLKAKNKKYQILDTIYPVYSTPNGDVWIINNN